MTSLSKLHKRVVALLSFSKLAAYLVELSTLSYIPQVVHHFGIPWKDIGHYQGLMFGTFLIATCLSTGIHGYALKVYNKKMVFVLSNTVLGISTFVYGLSYNLQMLLIMRAVVGFCSGIGMCVRVIAHDICTDKSNQSYVMTYAYAAPFTAALLIGPTLGGALALPVEQYPHVFNKGTVLDSMPMLLPNLVAGGILLAIATISLLTLPNTFKKEGSVGSQTVSAASTPNSSDDAIDEDRLLDTPTKSSDKNLMRSLMNNYDFIWSSLCNIFFQASTEGFFIVLTLLVVSPERYGGLHYSPLQTGSLYIIPGSIAMIFDYTLLGVTNKLLAPKRAYIIWGLLKSFLMAVAACVGGIQNHIVAFIVCTLLIAVMRIATSGCKVSVLIFANNSVTSQQIAVSSAVVQLSGYGIAALFSILLGPVYSWSLRNELNNNGVGFPFNHYLSFYIVTLLSLAGVYCTTRMSDTIDREN